MPQNDDGKKFCLEFTDFHGADMPWLMEKARAIGEVLVPRLGGNLEWGQVVVLPDRKGIGLGPRFPPEFYASHGKIRPVSPVIHSDREAGKRSRTQKPGRQGA